MQNWIRSSVRLCSGKFLTSVVIMMVALLSGLPPTVADPHTPKAVATLANESHIATSNLQETSQNRRIVIDLSAQRLFAWEGDQLVYSFRVSTGKRSTPTPLGKYRINSKYRVNRMRGRGYDIPDVPYAMYFYQGYAIHGAYWHNRFGTPVSHGCVNLPVKQARKLFNWASPGTLVVVQK